MGWLGDRLAESSTGFKLGRMKPFSPHFCKGWIPVAFVFSAPGEAEMRAGKPVAGDTGTNLESALIRLHSAQPTFFPSRHRYDYRITNAHPRPIAVALGHRGSEALNEEIRKRGNLERVLRELEDCHLVILGGNKAGLLANAIGRSGRHVITVPHVGNKGLNQKFKVPDRLRLASSSARRQHRTLGQLGSAWDRRRMTFRGRGNHVSNAREGWACHSSRPMRVRSPSESVHRLTSSRDGGASFDT
jgi:hypothetical protein